MWLRGDVLKNILSQPCWDPRGERTLTHNSRGDGADQSQSQMNSATHGCRVKTEQGRRWHAPSKPQHVDGRVTGDPAGGLAL